MLQSMNALLLIIKPELSVLQEPVWQQMVSQTTESPY